VKEQHRFAILPYSQVINWHTTTPSSASYKQRRAKKKSNPPIDTLFSIGWRFCYTHPQTSYGGDYESQEAGLQDGVLAMGWFGRWAAYAYDNHLNRTFWCTYQLQIRRRPFVISCPNICNYCSHNTNKATGGVVCGCRDDCTASDDDVVTGGWCTASS